MILRETILKCSDNSGAKLLKCISVRGGFRRNSANLGDAITAVVRTVDYKKKLLKKSIYSAVIIATKQPTPRLDGSFIKFDNNRAIILDKGNKFIGTKILGPVPKEIRGGHKEVKYKTLLSFAQEIV